MEYRNMGGSGLKVSLAGLGCNNFGRRVDQRGTRAVVDAAIDAGITLFDTADIYGDSLSEKYLGRALGKRRQDVAVVTKFGLPMRAGLGAREDVNLGSRRYAIAACEASLRRLGSDYIDLYLLHTPDSETPIAETLDVMSRLVDQGKVRYIGCSNFAGWQISDADWQAQINGSQRFIAAQNEWSLLERDIEPEVVPACERFGLGVMPFFPLASGLLSGKYKRGRKPPKGARLAADDDYYRALLSDANFTKIEALEAWTAKRGHSLLELAIAWLTSRPVVSTVIAGATKARQVKANVAATLGWRLNGDEIAAVETILKGG
jgi:aryl-alcohol dehydrogenase-like predicted oxidoreductase